jgi:hypothetical protein
MVGVQQMWVLWFEYEMSFEIIYVVKTCFCVGEKSIIEM